MPVELSTEAMEAEELIEFELLRGVDKEVD